MALQPESSTAVRVQIGNLVARFESADVEDFGSLAEARDEVSKRIPLRSLAPYLRGAASCASTDDWRAVLQCVLLDARTERLRIAATDSYRLFAADIEVSPTLGAQVLIPATYVELALSLFGDEPATTIALANHEVQVRSGNALLRIRCVEGEYPHLNAILEPWVPEDPVIFASDQMIGVLRRLRAVCDPVAPAILQLEGERILVLGGGSSSATGVSLRAHVPATGLSGQWDKLGVNPAYLEGVLSALGGDIEFSWEGGLRPVRLTSSSSEGTRCVLMPVRLVQGDGGPSVKDVGAGGGIRCGRARRRGLCANAVSLPLGSIVPYTPTNLHGPEGHEALPVTGT